MTVPHHIQHDFHALIARRGLTPNYLTALIMMVVLPAKWSHRKPQSDKLNFNTHFYGLETKTILTEKANRTVIHCLGNGANAAKAEMCASPRWEGANHVFWNYPGVSRSFGPGNHTDELTEAGYQLTKYLMVGQADQSHQFTINGHSLGGGVAATIAARLHHEGYCVDLVVDRSFSKVSDVIPAQLECFFAHETGGPFYTTLITFVLYGIVPGVLISEFMQSIHILLTMGIAQLGCYLPKPLSDLTYYIAYGLEACLNAVSTVIGAVIIVATTLVSLLTATLIGAVMEIIGVNMPMRHAFEVGLELTVGNLQTQKPLTEILQKEQHGHITVINTKNDSVIFPSASANSGIGCSDDPNRETAPLNYSGFKSIWYRNLGHFRPDHSVASEDTELRIEI